MTGISISVGRATRQAHLVYQRERPWCPLCRTRFEAAAYWPDLAWVDELPDLGQIYQGPNPDYTPPEGAADAMVVDGDDQSFEQLTEAKERSGRYDAGGAGCPPPGSGDRRARR